MKNRIVIVGYSGHSYGCIELALSLNIIIDGYYDIEEKSYNPYNLNYLGKEASIKTNHFPFISIGNNRIRKKIFENFSKNKIDLETILIHPKSIISNSSKIKKQTFVSAGAIICSHVNIGLSCIINTGAILEHESKIGDFTHIGPGSVLAGNVIIGENCMIGANSTIKEGVKIGNNVIVGAGSVILNDISSNLVVVGNPGKKLKIN